MRRGDLGVADAIAKDVFVRCSAGPNRSPLNRLGCYAVEIQWSLVTETYDRRRQTPGAPIPCALRKRERLFEEALRLGRESARLQVLQYGRDSVTVGETTPKKTAFCKKVGRLDAMNSMPFL